MTTRFEDVVINPNEIVCVVPSGMSDNAVEITFKRGGKVAILFKNLVKRNEFLLFIEMHTKEKS